MAKRNRVKGRRESGRFVGIPKVCMDHQNYIKLSMPAKALLHELCYQYNGFNNGDLCAPFSIMKKRGWKSKGTLARAIEELKKRGWIIISRYGGYNVCTLYALTFQSVDECKGKIDIPDTIKASGLWKKIDFDTPYEGQCTPIEGQSLRNVLETKL